ncbi:VanW family protein [Peribacillus alkalitolerans]|uniref:VanW family protein n=1 Tax=Peribacillus alkalitolerans TaxID=1550385 RepID=UPI0013D8439A|nr:VanW family protein [Peribacillus alkalitolerans]
MEQKAAISLRLFFIILFCTLFITAFSRIGVFAYETVFQPKLLFTENTYIGPVSVANLEQDQAIQKVIEETSTWSSSPKVEISFSDKSIPLPNELFYFQIDESVLAAGEGMTNPLFVTVKEQELKEQLLLLTDETIAEKIDVKRLKIEIEKTVGTLLQKAIVPFKLSEYISEDTLTQNVVLSEVKKEIKDKSQSELWLRKHREIVIPAKTNFSLLNYLQQTKESGFSNEFLTVIASSMYQSILPTNLQIVERHTSKEIPEGVQLGFEAKILKDDMDFIIFNPNDKEFVISFLPLETGLAIQVKGMKAGLSYKVRLENEKSYEPKKIIRYVANLNSIKPEQKVKGKKGYSISIYRDIFDQKGERLETVLIADDFYLPVNEVVFEEIGRAELGASEGIEQQIDNNTPENEDEVIDTDSSED